MSPTVVATGSAVSVRAPALTAARVATAPLDEVLDRSTLGPWSARADASARLIRYGPNALRTHRVSAIAVLGRQLRNAVLILLATTAVLSFFLGDSTQASSSASSWRPVSAWALSTSTAPNALRLHCIPASTIRPWCAATEQFCKVDVVELVPGDVIRLALGEAVPADVRLIDVNGLECNESILSGESSASEKSTHAVHGGRRADRFERSGIHGHHRQRR